VLAAFNGVLAQNNLKPLPAVTVPLAAPRCGG